MAARLNFLKRQLNFVSEEYGNIMLDLVKLSYKNDKEYSDMVKRRDLLMERFSELDFQVKIFSRSDSEPAEKRKQPGKLIKYDFK